MMKGLILFCTLLGSAVAYKGFQDIIPNGDLVPHPCKPNYLWQGVGHLVPGGGGKRNPFGVDFYRNGKKWDKCLCETDSDGDGKTNGEELGDPDCTWTPGTVPKVTTGLSHPGICEPLDSATCRVRNEPLGEICEEGGEINSCIEPIKSQEGMKNWTIAFTPTPVPAEETVYVCQVFEFPDNDTDYHAMAYQPHIDNQHVMHHILIYGCADDTEPTDGAEECGMAEESCRDLLFAWAVGGTGHCLDEAFGFRFGLSGFKKVMMQAHWNNPELRADYQDASGMVIYYSPNLRQNDGGMIMIGQQFLDIPPNRRDVEVHGSCSPTCMSFLPHPIYVSDVLIHMHYLGNKGYIYHKRDNTTLTEFVVQADYSYDSPIFFNHNPAVRVEPGDEIETVCHFKSTSRDKYTYWGEDTNAEMCYGFLTYYPKVPELHTCVQLLSADVCVPPAEEGVYFGCNQTAFEMTSEAVIRYVYTQCDLSGEECYPQCKETLDALAASDPCYRGDHLTYLKHTLRNYLGVTGITIEKMITSCDEKPDEENETKPADHEDSLDHNTQQGALCTALDDPDDENNSINDDDVSAAPYSIASLSLLFTLLSFYYSHV